MKMVFGFLKTKKKAEPTNSVKREKEELKHIETIVRSPMEIKISPKYADLDKEILNALVPRAKYDKIITEKVAENDDYEIYIYCANSSYRNGCFLRRNKHNKDEICYLCVSRKKFCLFKDVLFTVYDDTFHGNRYALETINILTGEGAVHYWFGEDLLPNIYGHFDSKFIIEEMSVQGEEMIIDIRDWQTLLSNGEHEACKIVIRRDDGAFVATEEKENESVEIERFVI